MFHRVEMRLESAGWMAKRGRKENGRSVKPHKNPLNFIRKPYLLLRIKQLSLNFYCRRFHRMLKCKNVMKFFNILPLPIILCVGQYPGFYRRELKGFSSAKEKSFGHDIDDDGTSLIRLIIGWDQISLSVSFSARFPFMFLPIIGSVDVLFEITPSKEKQPLYV